MYSDTWYNVYTYIMEEGVIKMTEKKDRLQFYIDPEANRQLNIVSENLGVSKAELIREGVNKVLQEKLPLRMIQPISLLD